MGWEGVSPVMGGEASGGMGRGVSSDGWCGIGRDGVSPVMGGVSLEDIYELI